MGSTILYQRYGGCVEKKNEEDSGLWCLEDSFGHVVVYMEAKGSLDF